MAHMLKKLLARRLKKREDEVWSLYDMCGYREVERVNWLHAAIYRSWEYKTDREQGILLLSTKNLAFMLGGAYIEIPLESITNIEWADGLGSVVLQYTESGGSASGGAFDFDVFGQTGPVALVLKDLFASQLLSQCQLAWSEKAARQGVKPTPAPPPPFTPKEDATAHAKRLAEQYSVGAAEMAARAEAADDAEADWAARVLTSKAEKKAAKAASSAAYLKTHGPGTSRGQG
jgi:hypothetical protein